jgi:glucokinase
MSHSKPYAIGIDIGGTNTVAGVVDTRGTVLASASIKTQCYPEIDDYLEALTGKLRTIMGSVGGPQMIAGIGVGAPNANFYSGNIEYAPNLPWKGVVPLAELLYEKVGIPISVTNDANAAAIGEMTYGAARTMRDFIMITLGTGVGSGIVVGGNLVYGHDGFAGELGHVNVCPGGRQCGCGRRGCLEAYCSATGVARTAREFLEQRDTPSSLRSLKPEEITSRDIYDAAIAGDALAKEVFDYTGRILGTAFADFTAFTSPEAFILFGGLAQAGELLRKPIVEAMNENLMQCWKDNIKVLFSELKAADAAVLGASALGWTAKA